MKSTSLSTCHASSSSSSFLLILLRSLALGLLRGFISIRHGQFFVKGLIKIMSIYFSGFHEIAIYKHIIEIPLNSLNF